MLDRLTAEGGGLERALAPGGLVDQLLDEDGLIERVLAEDGIADRLLAEDGLVDKLTAKQRPARTTRRRGRHPQPAFPGTGSAGTDHRDTARGRYDAEPGGQPAEQHRRRGFRFRAPRYSAPRPVRSERVRSDRLIDDEDVTPDKLNRLGPIHRPRQASLAQW